MSKADRDGGGGGTGPSGGSSNSGGTGSSGGRGGNTPGHPGNPGRRGAHAPGSTPASRARDAMARHNRENFDRSVGHAVMGEGATPVGDNDAQYGSGLSAHDQMDNQRTEAALNDAGITDSLGMRELDRLNAAERYGAAFSSHDRRALRGIRAGERNQFTANRATDLVGMIGLGAPVGIIGDAVVEGSKPSDVLRSDYNEGRKMANDRELGAVGETVAGLSLGKLGVSAPVGMVNTVQAMVRRAHEDPDNATAFGAPDADTNEAGNSPGQGRGAAQSASASLASARAAMQPRQVSLEAYSAPVIDRNQYSRGLLSLAQKIR